MNCYFKIQSMIKKISFYSLFCCQLLVCLFLVFFYSVGFVQAATTIQQPALLKDIDPAGDGYPYAATTNDNENSANIFALFNNEVYFMAEDGVHGTELWKSDGTPDGTEMVKDINPGGGNSSANNFIVLGEYLYFIADNNGTNNFELWRTDGTSDGTIMVKEINQY